MMTRTPYSVGPYGADRVSARDSARRRASRDEGFIFVYQDVRGRFMSEGDFVHMTPCDRGMAGAAKTDESTDTYDTIDWLREERPAQQRPRRHVGHLLSRLLRGGGADDAHPALKAVSPQAPQADWFMGDDVHHTARSSSPQRVQLLHDESAARGRRRRRQTRPRRSTTAPTTATRSSSTWGRSRTPTSVLQGRVAVLERHDGARRPRRVLAGAQGRAASQGREAGGAHRQRMVRREQSTRRAACVRGDRATESGDSQPHRDRSLVARTVGPRRPATRSAI